MVIICMMQIVYNADNLHTISGENTKHIANLTSAKLAQRAVMVKTTQGRISTIFGRKDNFWDFLFAFLSCTPKYSERGLFLGANSFL